MQKQNDVFYIQEAFKKLQFLNEDSFNLQDVGVVDELTSFVADDKDAPWIEEIIDVESDFTDELQDSYVGKVILQCKCCNAKIYKDASEVFVSEEDECANVEEECPLCGNAYGWSVIGKIEPYNEEEFKEEEPVEADLELDLTDDEINEALKKSISEDLDIHVQQDENGNVEEVIIEKEPEDNVVIDDESPKLSGDDIIIDESYNREEFKKEILSSYRRVKTLFGDKLDKFLDILEKESNNGEKEVLHILYPDKYNGKNSKFYLNEFGLDITKHGVASTIADILWSFDSANNDLLDDTKYMVSVTYFDPDSPDEDNGPQYVSRDLKKLVDTINNKENLNIKFDTVNKSIESDEFSHDYTYDGEYIDVWFKKLKKFDHVDDYINLDESLNEEVDIKVDSTPEGKLTAEVEVDEGEHVEVVDKEEVELPAEDIEVVEESVSNQNELNSDVYNALGNVAYKYEVDKEENLTKADMKKATDNFNDKFFAIEEGLDTKYVVYLDGKEISGEFDSKEEAKFEAERLWSERGYEDGFEDRISIERVSVYEESLKEELKHNSLEDSNLEDADTKAKTNSEIFKQALKRSALKQFNFGTNHAEDHDVYAELGDYLLIGFSPSGSCWYSSMDDDEKEFKSVKALINSLKKNGWPELFKDEIKEELKHNSLEDVNIDIEEASDDAQKLENPEEEPVKEELNEDLEAGKIYKSPTAGSYKFIDIVETKNGKLYRFKPLNKLAIKTSNEVAIDEPYAFDGKYSYMPRETVEYTFFDNINESLNEDIENLSLDTESTHMEMTSDENGKVVVMTEPRKEVEEVVEVEDEMIAPLSDEEKEEILNNEEVVDEPIEDEFEIDEFEEETFNELGESFLKRVYENVNSFKTSSVAYKKGQLVVEGLIKFNSGKEKSTSFIFEKFKNTKRNKVVVTGLNETFSKSKSAFMLKGDLKNKKFVSESLIYNYSTHSLNESNKQEAVKVYGRAIVRNK